MVTASRVGSSTKASATERAKQLGSSFSGLVFTGCVWLIAEPRERYPGLPNRAKQIQCLQERDFERFLLILCANDVCILLGRKVRLLRTRANRQTLATRTDKPACGKRLSLSMGDVINRPFPGV